MYLSESIAQKNKCDNILHFCIYGMIPVTLPKLRCYTENSKKSEGMVYLVSNAPERMMIDMKTIELHENGLDIQFRVRENGVVELADFSAQEVKKEAMEPKEDIYYPAVEIHRSGTGSLNMHAYKNNINQSSVDFVYEKHELKELSGGKELEIVMTSPEKLKAVYHMRLFDGVPAVQTWTEITNEGSEDQGLTYVSSFVYQGISRGGEKPYYKKTDIYVPFNSWSCEAQWQKYDAETLNLNGMMVDGFNHQGYGLNRYSYSGKGSWSTCEYLPMGIAEDRETGETYIFQVESSGQWLVEYGSAQGGNLYVILSGAAEQEHGWYKNLKPGESFSTVPAGAAVVKGGLNPAVAALTRYRRCVRRPNQDDVKLNVVFNDYMNCLMGDPTTERELPIIDKAAELGCEYYCLDAGWYDDGFWWDRVGEWKEAPRRFPGGLKEVCDYAHSKGLKMGLWLEIEVMGVACELAKKLPDDWFICRHGKRHIDNKRYLLDFRNPEVRKYCRDVVDRLIDDYGVEYFKVDYNVTMGYGSELNSDSCADAVREHYECLHQWYEEIFRDHPDLVVENCSSGGQRMDYGMLKVLSLQSTSDQTDYIYNANIAANVASAVTPEQGGMWVYPYEDEEEHVVYNVVNGMLLRPYISGMVWKLGENSMNRMKEGIALYKEIREEVRDGVPFFPLGFGTLKSEVLAYGIKAEKNTYLSVWTPGTTEAVIPLEDSEKISKVSVIYPKEEMCEYKVEDGKLVVKMPQEKAARFFKIEMK